MFLAVFEIPLSFLLAGILKWAGMSYQDAIILVPGIPAVMGTVVLMTRTEYNY